MWSKLGAIFYVIVISNASLCFFLMCSTEISSYLTTSSLRWKCKLFFLDYLKKSCILFRLGILFFWWFFTTFMRMLQYHLVFSLRRCRCDESYISAWSLPCIIYNLYIFIKYTIWIYYMVSVLSIGTWTQFLLYRLSCWRYTSYGLYSVSPFLNKTRQIMWFLPCQI